MDRGTERGVFRDNEPKELKLFRCDKIVSPNIEWDLQWANIEGSCTQFNDEYKR
jgi:hypothetical protein